jgi:endonuclease/exonuclease/phosphatase family metal-dependent hydrolase
MMADGGLGIGDSRGRKRMRPARAPSSLRARLLNIRSPRPAIRNLFACLLFASLCLLPAPAAAVKDGAACVVVDAPERLLETGVAPDAAAGEGGARFRHAVNSVGQEGEIRIVSYNMRWRGGDDLRRLIRTLRDDTEIGGAHIIGLQEVDRNRKRSGNVNAARLMAEELGMHYAWAAPPCDGRKRDDREAGEDETGVAILSRFPLADVERIVLPHAGPGCRRRAAVGATVSVAGTPVRVYSLHAETRLDIEKKIEQWRAPIDSLARRPAVSRAVVLGDFNSIKGKDVRAARELFSSADFTTPFPDDKSTWKTFVIKLKLDWLWLRGLTVTSHGISKHVKFSDHWPLWVKVKMP